MTVVISCFILRRGLLARGCPPRYQRFSCHESWGKLHFCSDGYCLDLFAGTKGHAFAAGWQQNAATPTSYEHFIGPILSLGFREDSQCREVFSAMDSNFFGGLQQRFKARHPLYSRPACKTRACSCAVKCMYSTCHLLQGQAGTLETQLVCRTAEGPLLFLLFQPFQGSWPVQNVELLRFNRLRRTPANVLGQFL